MEAWFVELPGWSIGYCPENVITADQFPIRIKNLTVAVNGENNHEVQALSIAKSLYRDGDKYELIKKDDGHWILYRPARHERLFTLSAYYRISPWKPTQTTN